MWQSGWRISSSNKCEFSLSGRILEIHEGIGEWREAVCNSIVNMTINVSVSYEAMYDFSCTH